MRRQELRNIEGQLHDVMGSYCSIGLANAGRLCRRLHAVVVCASAEAAAERGGRRAAPTRTTRTNSVEGQCRCD